MPKKKHFKVQAHHRLGRVMDAPSHHWVYRFLPRICWPYAQLARWDRPIGWQLLLWPCWWSVALVSVAGNSDISTPLSENPGLHIWYLLLFFIGAVAMRGAGCTYNDLIDHRIDNLVERTRSRPLPSAQTSRLQAKIFLVLQTLVGLIVLLQFNLFTIVLGSASLVIVALYPFMKRLTDWPQLFLGLAFNWGALLGWTAWQGRLDWPPLLLYAGAVCWTIGYDTIYAHQDREDDAIIGVRSTARMFGQHTKTALWLLYGMMIALTGAALALAGVGVAAYGGLVGAALQLSYQIKRIDIDKPEQCLRLFRSNFHVGWLLFLGLIPGSIFPS